MGAGFAAADVSAVAHLTCSVFSTATFNTADADDSVRD